MNPTMPLTEIRRLNEHTLLGRWALTETVAQLQALPGLPAQLALPENLTHEKRRREWLASRTLSYWLLRQCTPAIYLLQNDESGKPTLTNSSYQISISHSPREVAVLLSGQYGVGIDIEIVRPKIQRVRDRFLTATEKAYIGHDLTQLTIAWSAKETLYKLFSQKNIIFAEHLFLAPFALAAAGALAAKIKTTLFEQKYTVYFECRGDTVLTYCLADKQQLRVNQP